MEFFHLLVIQYMVSGHRQETKIWFPSEDACWSVLVDRNSLYDKINGEAGWCIDSEIPSKIVKPKLRPF